MQRDRPKPSGARHRRVLHALLLGVACAAVGLLPLLAISGNAHAAKWGKEYLPNVDVVDHHGRPLKFFDDLIDGKIVVISFIYTSCRSVCPLAISRLRDARDLLGEDGRSKISFISISIDPIPDTPEKLSQYAAAFNVDSGWTFVTGDPANIDLIRYRLGERSGAVISLHKNEVLMFNEPTGAWSRDSAFSDIGVLAMNIRAMHPPWRDVAATHVELPAGMVADPDRPGQALFAKACAGCHTIGNGRKVGPDLAGVTTRRSAEWITRYVTAPEKVRTAGDPIAAELRQAYPNIRMPSLGLSETDAADVIAYLTARTAEHKATLDH